MRSYLQTLLAITLSIVIFSGCSKQPQPAPKVIIDKSLPTPILNGHISDMNAIAFEWKSIADNRVEGYYIYRSNPEAKDEKLHRIATVEGRYVTHFIDSELKPNQNFAYRFSTYKADGSESLGSKTYRASTLPLFASVSFFQSIGNMPRSAKLIWRPHTDLRVKFYRIERKLRSENEWKSITEIYGRLNAEYIDMDLNDGEVYQYRIFANTFENIQSSPSDIVTVVTKPLPETIKGVALSDNLPKKIRLSWQPSERENLDHYNIYRSTSENGTFKYHVKLHENVFVDTIETDGTRYFYKITAVDSDGLESKKESVYSGKSLHAPKTPTQFRGMLKDHTVRLSWSEGSDDTVNYVIIKTKKEGWLDKSVIEIADIRTTQYSDMEVTGNSTYFYQIVALNQYGIRSEPTEAIELSIEAK
jgi:fibronectin type 3 domain-containing protein